ncbi:hypothetical protein M406DRAFT_62500 [Cryphonectria parasitica EP155]|uniref:O-methyltransferase domain-containing protein n=1 Tax=Cryphonectria parasitica (strain ATCC 38755 / EP155) TaxID=660469 RepID=A0A9P4Y0H9_CRYP1|nr:uncharacterized protein M406DRAFT_62500 [Cryphonectria parasitica EP155]KAF3764264.1 hypothetical protein M406DRAFT_62500 [Cryphonectria parasitica EP155]
MPLQMDRIIALTEQLSQGVKTLNLEDDKTRARLLEAAWSLARALETPRETLLRTCLLDSTTNTVIKVAFDLKLFQQLDEKQAKGTAELAEETGAEEALLSRLLKHLASTGFIGEAGPDLYIANDLAQILATENVQDGFEIHLATLRVLPEYLAEHGYRDPTDGLDCPMQKAFNTKLHSFEYIKRDPKLARGFKAAVLDQAGLRRAHWAEPEFYPVQERLLAGLKKDSVVMVDVGGGMGLDLRLLADLADTRLILQDTEQVLSGTNELPARIEKMPYDFFQRQPVEGARAYYFHRVFHDWTDEKCREILLALKPAMTRGYSKVLIQDNVIPAQGATWLHTTSDLLMLCGFAGKERTEKNFRELFDSVGMRVTGIWTRAPGEESIIEAIVPE